MEKEKPAGFFKKYASPQGPFEWIFFGILIIGALVVIGFLFSMYAQVQ